MPINSVTLREKFAVVVPKNPIDPDQIVERMRRVRAFGFQRASELHDDAKRLVDWKAYARATPLVSAAAMSLLGFGAIRFIFSRGGRESTRSTLDKRPARAGSQVPNDWKSGAIAFASQMAQSTLKKYILHFVQHQLFERTAHDQSTESNTGARRNGQNSSSN